MAIIPQLPITGAQLRTTLSDIATELSDKASSNSIPSTDGIQTIAAAILQNGNHQNIQVQWDDVAKTVNLIADVANADPEEVEAIIGGLLVEDPGINLNYDPVIRSLKVGLSGVSFSQADKTKLDALSDDLSVRVESLESRPFLEGAISRDGVLVLQQSDGSEIIGPVLLDGLSAPARYTSSQWDVVTGPGPSQITVVIKDEIHDGGSPLTSIKYRVGSGALQVLTLEPAIGEYPLTMAQASTSYSLSILAANAIGDGPISLAKTVTSAAPAQAPQPPAFDPVPGGFEILSLGEDLPDWTYSAVPNGFEIQQGA